MTPEKLRIALVLGASTGGIGRHVASVATRLQRRGHQVEVVCPEVTARAQDFADLGVPVRPLRELVRVRADVLHAHGYKAGGWALAVAAVRRTPLVVTWHNAVLGSGPGPTAARLLQRTVARGADLTLGASTDLVLTAERLGARVARLGPVAAPALPPAGTSREVQRARWLAGADDVVVLTVGRLAPQKNLSMVLDIAAALRGDRRFRFVVAGEGPLRNELAARINADRSPVQLVGRQEDVAALLGAADLALLTSTWEARALVAQEALRAGLPLVSTRVGGIEELVGDAARLVELGDVAAAVAGLRALAADPAARHRLAEAGRRRAQTWPDEDGVVDDLLLAYAQLRVAAWHST